MGSEDRVGEDRDRERLRDRYRDREGETKKDPETGGERMQNRQETIKGRHRDKCQETEREK